MAVDTTSFVPAATPQQVRPRRTSSVPAHLELDVEPPHRRVSIEGIVFDALRERDVVSHVLHGLARGEGGNLVTPNVDILRQLRRAELRRLAEDAELVVPDGMPIVWASRILGTELPERVTGSSLIWSLSRGAASEGRSIYLLGGAPGIAARAAANLEHAIPGVTVAGVACPPMGFEKSDDEMERICQGIADAAPEIVFVALGFPKQELLMERLRVRFPAMWFVGCGGTLTMVAGEVERAPEWIQKSGLEWVHRLVKEPRRMARRYLVDDLPYAAGMMLRTIRASRKRVTAVE